MEETHQGHLGAMGHEQNPVPVPPVPVAIPKGQETRAKAALTEQAREAGVAAANKGSAADARDRAIPPDQRAAPTGSPGAPPEMLSERSKPESHSHVTGENGCCWQAP